MPLVMEMVHPRGLDFTAQRQVVLLRDVHKLEWAKIASRVRNLAGKRPKPRTCAIYYRKFVSKVGRRVSMYHKCGPQRPFKVTKEVEKFLLSRLKAVRRRTLCTSRSLQLDLAREKKVDVTVRYIRKLLRKHGYHWLPKRQSRLYSNEEVW